VLFLPLGWPSISGCDQRMVAPLTSPPTASPPVPREQNKRECSRGSQLPDHGYPLMTKPGTGNMPVDSRAFEGP
jgi:hypothetical protein